MSKQPTQQTAKQQSNADKGASQSQKAGASSQPQQYQQRQLAAEMKLKEEQQKEQEALRQAEEKRRLEELLKQEQESLKYDAVVLPTGLECNLTEYCVQEAWASASPKEFIIGFITRYLKKQDLIENFETIEINILAEFHLYNLIFAKEELTLDDYKTMVLLNIFWQLLKLNNINYAKKKQVDEQDQAQKLKQRMVTNPINKAVQKNKTQFSVVEQVQQKTIERDIEEFKKLIKDHSIDNKPRQIKIFQENEVKKMMEYIKDGFLQHYSLFQYVFNNPQKKEEIKITIQIDTPLEQQPLSEALYMGKDVFEVRDEEDDYHQELAEKLNKKKLEIEEHEKLKQEQFKKEVGVEKNQNSNNIIVQDQIQKLSEMQQIQWKNDMSQSILNLDHQIEQITQQVQGKKR